VATFPPVIHNVIDGETVESSNTNRPTNELNARTLFLKEQLDAIQRLFEVLTIQDRPVGDLVLENQIVYFNSATEKLESAVAELASFGMPPQYAPTDRCFVVGIAQNIRGLPGSKICDLRLGGLAEATTFTNLIETTETVVLGKPYWLSTKPSEAGRCTQTRLGLEYMVGVFFSTTEFYFFPQLKALGEEHLHYRFKIDNADWIDLGPSVAMTGTPTFTPASSAVTGVGTLFTTELAPGSVIFLDADDLWVRVDSITSDTALVLVLPYGGAGGAGASSITVGPFLIDKVEFDPFPPIPYDSTEMVLNGHLLEYGVDYDMSIDGLNYLSAEYPPSFEMFDVTVYYIQPISKSSPGVTLLKSATPNVQITNCSPGGPADSGNLQIGVIPSIVFSSLIAAGTLAIKSLVVNQTTGEITATAGPMVEQLIAGPGVSLSPSGGKGKVTVTATAADELREEIPDILLQNAKQSFHNLTPYIEFPEGSKSAFIGKIRLPATINTGIPLRFLFEMIGETDTATADTIMFELEYNIVDVSLTESILKPKQVAAKTVVMAADYVAYNTFTAIVMEIAGSQLVPNATLSFSLRRLDTLDTYEGNVGIINPQYTIKLT